MLIYRCDKCGLEHQATDGIVGNLHKQHGYETLERFVRFEFEGRTVVDVCRACFSEIGDAWFDRKVAEAKAQKQGFLRRLLGPKA